MLSPQDLKYIVLLWHREQYTRHHDLKPASILVGDLQQNTGGSFGSACSYWSTLATTACVIQKSHAIFITRHHGTTNFVRALKYNISESCDIFLCCISCHKLVSCGKVVLFKFTLEEDWTWVLVLRHVFGYTLCVVVLRTLLSIWDRFVFPL